MTEMRVPELQRQIEIVDREIVMTRATKRMLQRRLDITSAALADLIAQRCAIQDELIQVFKKEHKPGEPIANHDPQ